MCLVILSMVVALTIKSHCLLLLKCLKLHSLIQVSLRYLIGVLYVNFSLIWEPVIEMIRLDIKCSVLTCIVSESKVQVDFTHFFELLLECRRTYINTLLSYNSGFVVFIFTALMLWRRIKICSGQFLDIFWKNHLNLQVKSICMVVICYDYWFLNVSRREPFTRVAFQISRLLEVA